jgi:hypothetical protein
MTSAGEPPMPRDQVRLPPRHELPRDVTVASLPGLGTTWYDRGPGYRARRAGMALMWLVVTGLFTVIVIGLLAGLRHKSMAGFYVVLVLEVVYSLGILVFFAVRTVQHRNDTRPVAAGIGKPRRGDHPPAAGQARSALGQLLLAPSFLFVGLYLAMLVTSVLPETPAERRARLSLAEALRERGHPAR